MVPIGGDGVRFMPPGANPGRLRATMALYEPLRREPQITSTFRLLGSTMACPFGRSKAPHRYHVGARDSEPGGRKPLMQENPPSSFRGAAQRRARNDDPGIHRISSASTSLLRPTSRAAVAIAPHVSSGSGMPSASRVARERA